MGLSASGMAKRATSIISRRKHMRNRFDVDEE